MSRLIATVYIPGVNKSLMTGPGRKLEFRGGAAGVVEQHDMPIVLAMAGAKVEVEPNWIDWLPTWATQCAVNAPATASVRVSGPTGDLIKIGPPPTYTIDRTALDASKASSGSRGSTEQPSGRAPWAAPRKPRRARTDAAVVGA